ncbi:hypothetical protein T4B_5312 [Trichinella pseudospiralis]|uniref:Uncharacterized protein n=1 Tax=Trichinella pseudospiralis TaxID=6337 RepID=A0A0V1H600_TRIPS|nr:hypothetical protein T4B_5312 [Trichinella pseudospiralis]
MIGLLCWLGKFFLILLCPSLHSGMHNERAICIVALKRNLHKGVHIAMSEDGMWSTIIPLFNTICNDEKAILFPGAESKLPMMYNNVNIILGKTERKCSLKTSSEVMSLLSKLHYVLWIRIPMKNALRY